MKADSKILNRISGIASKQIPDSEIYLYGSRARGDSNELSDWDILVLLNNKSLTFESETKIMDLFYDLELETGQLISPLIYSKKDWEENHRFSPLYLNILKEGVKIK
jgi:predicted nucleotidyltransferase